MLKKVSSLFVALILAVSALIAPVHAGGLPNPDIGGVPGSWTAGNDPAAIDPEKPAILFVHGLNSSASTWYQNNDMYQLAYDNGYQTAFINLHDVAGTAQNMWDNGKLLADKIKEISGHFGKKLVIVAHSKGGVDTQTALVHYNAYPYVSNVITLGTPHRGSQLADLAYSSWAGWLADLIGSQNPGTYSMQTSYMSYFRSVTDSHANAGKNEFYTFAGDNWHSGSASHLLGGLYLSNYGANDGVVTVANAYEPNGTLVKVGEWNHTSVKTGSSVFSLFKPYLSLKTAEADRSLAKIAMDTDKAQQDEQISQSFVRGGQRNGQTAETFTVENDVSSITVDWIDGKPLDKLQLTGPDGTVHSVRISSADDEDVFSGAWHHTATISKPKAGEWKVSAASSQPSAYLFTVVYETKGQAKMKLQYERNGKKLKVKGDGLKADRTRLTYNIDYVKDEAMKFAGKQKPKRLEQKKQSTAAEEIAIPASEGAGTYSVTAEIEGETTEGFKYRRTLVKSVYVDDQGNIYTP